MTAHPPATKMELPRGTGRSVGRRPRRGAVFRGEMTKTVELKIPGPTGLEGKTNRLIALVWLVLWATIGGGILLGLGEWHGFFWGFIVAGLASVFGTWYLYAKPMTRKKCSAILSWDGGAMRISSVDGETLSEVRVDESHRVLLIRSKAEGEVLLRVESVDENARSGERLDLLGPLPVVLPVRVTGDAPSFVGFRPGIARSSDDERLPYQICADGSEGDALMTDLLRFLDEHSDRRLELINFRAGDRVVHLDPEGFTVDRGDESYRLDFDGSIGVEGIARPLETGDPELDRASAAEVFVALVPDGRHGDALVFEMLAIDDWLGQLPEDWDMPKEAMENRVLLYDDTPAAFVAKRALRRYVKKFAPSSPALEILRS